MKFFRLLLPSLLIVLAAGCKHDQAVPQELVGNWVTQDARYKGKSLTIDQQGFIVLIVDEDSQPKAEHIDSMTVTKAAGLTTYVFETSDQADVPGKMTITYRPVNGELRLAHPSSVVWQRQAPAEEQPAQ